MHSTEFLWTFGSAAPADAARPSLRASMAADGLALVPGVHDGISARICELAGFECVMTSARLIAWSFLGLPHADFLSTSQLADAVARITGAISIPLYVKLEARSVTLASVGLVVHELAKAGAAGICISDDRIAVGIEGAACPAPDISALIRAACEERHDPELVIAAHCDARGPDAAGQIGRWCLACVQAGAEIVSVTSALDRKALAAVAAHAGAVKLGLSVEQEDTPFVGINPAALQNMGYKLVFSETAMLRAASVGLIEYAKDLSENGAAADLRLVDRLRDLPIEDWYQFTGFDRIRRLEDAFLPPEALSKYQNDTFSYYKPGN